MKTRLTTLLSLFPVITCPFVKKTMSTDIPYTNERLLIITADDFGASKNINEGIAIAADKKAITAISILSNFSESLNELKQISEKHPDIGIGVHLNITTGKPVLAAEQVPSLVSTTGNFYPIDELLSKIRSISFSDLRKELRAQILILKKYDIRPDHLSDQNGILSLYNPFFDILIELAEEFDLALRTPVIASVKYPEIFHNSKMKKHGRQIAFRFALSHPFKAISLLKYSRIHEMEKKVQNLNEHKILHPDLFIEYFWGDPTPDNFLYIMEHLPNGISEIVLHIGTYTRQNIYPSGLDLNYFKNREKELLTVTGDYLKDYFSYLKIKTIGYSRIPKLKPFDPDLK
jgi:chitin disaccharide deacetylase